MKKTEDSKALRRKTEEKVASQPVFTSEIDIMRLLHELQVQKVELEEQNEELKRSNQALQEHEDHLQSIINMTPAGYFRLDADDCFVDVNDAWLKMHIYSSRDEIIGKHFSMLQVDSVSDSALKHLAELHRGKPIPVGEFTSRRKDGSVGHHVFSAHPVLQTGRIVGFEWFIIDITERKQAEDDLKESEARFRLIIKTAPDAIFVRDKESFSYLNDAALTLFGAGSSDELLGKPILDHYHPTVRDSIRDRMEIINEKRQAVPLYQSICLKLDGSEVNVESSAVPITYQGKSGALVFMRDITDRLVKQIHHQHVEEQLHQSQKIESIGQLAGGVAHDFNNMLCVILGHAEMALRKAPPLCLILSDLEEIHKATNRSTDLTRQLLTFARKQVIAPKVLDLNESVTGTLKMLQRLIGENIQLSWDASANLWPVKIDPSQMDQILANLCVNARDAISGPGKISIKTENRTLDESATNAFPFDVVSGDYVRLSVSDDGCGMDKEVQSHIFEPFYTTKEVGSGTGLGLASVYGAVKQNNGFITFDSELGLGAIFDIYLPRACKAVEAKQETAEETLLFGTETILLVEDDKMVLDMEMSMLKENGYTVLAAITPDIAQSFAKEHPGPIHLLMSDMIMPVMNGRELSERLQPLRPEMKVLFLSGYSSEIISQQGVLDENIHFLQKPFSFEVLTSKVREMLDDR